MIYQELNLVPHLSVAENVFLGAAPTRFPGIIDWRRLMASTATLLADLGMNIDAGTPLHRLSLAQRQMVEIAKALRDHSTHETPQADSRQPASILVMDEPTSALTSREVDQLFGLIARLVERNVAVVYITHRLDEVYRIGHRVTVLRDGKHIATTPLSEVTVDELVRMMANRDLTEHYPRRRATPGKELLRVEGLGRRGRAHRHQLCAARGRSGWELRDCWAPGAASWRGFSPAPIAPTRAGFFVTAKRCRFARPPTPLPGASACFRRIARRRAWSPALTVARNLSLPHGRRLSRAGFLPSQCEERLAEPVVSELRVKATPTQAVKLLSGGNQQKVVLGKWIAGDARVFIFDEPTRGVDVGAKVEIYNLMNRLTESGAAIIMISSELPELLGMSDRILVMRGGRIQDEFDAQAATQEKILSAALGCRHLS